MPRKRTYRLEEELRRRHYRITDAAQPGWIRILSDDRRPKTFLVSRHPAAQRWLFDEARRREWRDVIVVPHYRLEQVGLGDRIVGTMPIHLAAEICACGAEYWHLEVAVEQQDRGRELTFEELVHFGARIRRYQVVLLED